MSSYDHMHLAYGHILTCDYFVSYDGTLRHTNGVTIHTNQHGVSAADWANRHAERLAIEADVARDHIANR